MAETGARVAVIAGVLLGAGGCADILGIEQRTFDGSIACETTIDCAESLGSGQFCSQGRCSSTPPEDDACHMLEPEELDDVGDHDFANGDPVILGTVLQPTRPAESTRAEAMRLAVREINFSGGLGATRRLVLVTCDYKTGAPSLQTGVDYLARGLGAAVIAGPIPSVNTQAVVDYVVGQELSVAVVSSTSTSTALTEYPDDGLLWRTSPNDEGQAAVLADIINGTSVSKLAIVYINDTYGSALQEGVNAGVTTDTALFPYQDGGDFDALMEDVAAFGPDGMMLISLQASNVVLMYEALVAAGLHTSIDAHFLADSAKSSELLDEGLSAEVKAELAQALGTAPYHSLEPHYDTFAVNLTNAGVNPDATSFLAQSYDAAYLAGYGLAYAQAAPTPRLGARVVEGFAQLVAGEAIDVGRTDWPAAVATLTNPDLSLDERQIDIDGTGGPLDFVLSTGDAPGNYEIWRVDGTMFTTCAVCLTDEACDVSGC